MPRALRIKPHSGGVEGPQEQVALAVVVVGMVHGAHGVDANSDALCVDSSALRFWQAVTIVCDG